MQKKNGMKLLHGHNIKPRFLIYTAQSRCAQLSWLKKKCLSPILIFLFQI
jgi:hypothetical protein